MVRYSLCCVSTEESSDSEARWNCFARRSTFLPTLSLISLPLSYLSLSLISLPLSYLSLSLISLPLSYLSPSLLSLSLSLISPSLPLSHTGKEIQALMKKQTGGDETSEEEEPEEHRPPKLSSSSAAAATGSAAGGSGGGASQSVSQSVSPRPATPSKSHSKGYHIVPLNICFS